MSEAASYGLGQIPNGEARMDAMEANGADYFSFKGLVNTFMSGYAKVTDATDAALVSVLTRIGVLEATSSTFVSAATMSVANLLANYPPSSANVGKYARVNDLYGSVDEILRCRYDGVAYRWVAQRTNFNTTIASTGTINLTPLVTPPTVRLPATLTGNVNLNPVATNASIGDRFRVVTGGLGIYTVTLTNLIGSNLTLLGNTTRDVEYSAGGWFAVSG